jgi:type VI secretion system protein ImpF
MPDQRLPQERLQPALLDRLIDDEPENQKPEPIQRRVMSKELMRQAVIRDLEALFNTTCAEAAESFEGYPSVRLSVVNFGLPAFSGKTASSFEVKDLENAIRDTIKAYEPRILPESLKVRALEFVGLDHHNKIGIEISGQLWAQPMALELLLRTTLNLESGVVEFPERKRIQER